MADGRRAIYKTCVTSKTFATKETIMFGVLTVIALFMGAVLDR